MNNAIILANKEHPLFEKLKNSDAAFYDVEKDEPFENKNNRYNEASIVFDFCVLSTERKEKLLNFLNKEFNIPIVSDLSTHWSEGILEKYDHISGSVACQFFSPKNTYEYFFKDEKTDEYIQKLFKGIGINGLKVQNSGCGFTYPRVISMIINEAYFSLEDQLAEKEDIDTAMQFGVNYPMGPFKWAKEIGLPPIVQLLDELYKVTGDPRYRASKELRLQSFNN